MVIASGVTWALGIHRTASSAPPAWLEIVNDNWAEKEWY